MTGSLTYTTVAASGNCVVNQPSNANAPALLVSSACIEATIVNWSAGGTQTIVVGHVVQG